MRIYVKIIRKSIKFMIYYLYYDLKIRIYAKIIRILISEERRMIIQRDKYLNLLIRKKDNGFVKVITGIRRCGKSFLLFNLYHSYLNSIGIDDSNIIELSLEDDSNALYRNPLELGSFIRSKLVDKDKKYYVFIDEIQKVEDIINPYLKENNSKIGFIDVVLGLMKIKNVDLYITGSNSKMLSSDIVTDFRDRGDEIKLNPLSFSEFYSSFSGEKRNALSEYLTYGGMPRVAGMLTHEEKSKYLTNLFQNTYMDDVIERHRLNNEKYILEDILKVVSSSIGSLTNPTRLSNTFLSASKISINAATIDRYLDFFIDAFILNKAYRYDVKGRKYIGTPLKYYFSDVGLRNAMINFRQAENNHIMENVIYNELVCRGFSVDVGVVEHNYKDSEGKSKKAQLEIDFIATIINRSYYIQSAFSVDSPEKRNQEIRPFLKVHDSFKKIVVLKDNIIPYYDENGILFVGIEEFLLDERYTT